jgi:hypothetical protein
MNVQMDLLTEEFYLMKKREKLLKQTKSVFIQIKDINFLRKQSRN